MAEQQILEFFQKKKRKAGPGNVDWRAKRDAWVKAIEDLYRTITGKYLAGPKAAGTVTFSFKEKPIVEDGIGAYTVRELVLHAGSEKVFFSPIGMKIVGASGRIDILGQRGTATLIRQPGRWSVVESRTPTLKIVELNEENLLMALTRVMRP